MVNFKFASFMICVGVILNTGTLQLLAIDKLLQSVISNYLFVAVKRTNYMNRTYFSCILTVINGQPPIAGILIICLHNIYNTNIIF